MQKVQDIKKMFSNLNLWKTIIDNIGFGFLKIRIERLLQISFYNVCRIKLNIILRIIIITN